MDSPPTHNVNILLFNHPLNASGSRIRATVLSLCPGFVVLGSFLSWMFVGELSDIHCSIKRRLRYALVDVVWLVQRTDCSRKTLFRDTPSLTTPWVTHRPSYKQLEDYIGLHVDRALFLNLRQIGKHWSSSFYPTPSNLVKQEACSSSANRAKPM